MLSQKLRGVHESYHLNPDINSPEPLFISDPNKILKTKIIIFSINIKYEKLL